MPARILVADDNPIVRTTLRLLLEGIGQSGIIEAENGREAVSKTVELRPDVVILDLAMPVLDGLHAAREISQQLPQTPMLIYTMHWSPHLEVEAQKFGVRKIISKANSSLLLSSVQQLLDEIPPPPALHAAEAIPPHILQPSEPAAKLVPSEPSLPSPAVSLAAEAGPASSQPEAAEDPPAELSPSTVSDPPGESN